MFRGFFEFFFISKDLLIVEKRIDRSIDLRDAILSIFRTRKLFRTSAEKYTFSHQSEKKQRKIGFVARKIAPHSSRKTNFSRPYYGNNYYIENDKRRAKESWIGSAKLKLLHRTDKHLDWKVISMGTSCLLLVSA